MNKKHVLPSVLTAAVTNVFPVLLLSGLVLAGTAHAGSISILGEDGKVFRLDTTSGLATLALTFADPGGSNEEQFSPNGLGISGGKVFFTSFNVNGPTDTLYRDGSVLTTISAGNPFNIANGDAVGSNFHFVDRHTGEFYTVGNIFGAPGSQTIASVPFLASPNTMGDLAISGTTGYLSYDTVLRKFDTTTLASTEVGLNRYVGLGFDGGNLYGVLRVGVNNFDLYSINTGSLTQTLVADITGIPTTGGAQGNYEITDACEIIPEPYTLSLLGLGGLVMLLRKR